MTTLIAVALFWVAAIYLLRWNPPLTLGTPGVLILWTVAPAWFWAGLLMVAAGTALWWLRNDARPGTAVVPARSQAPEPMTLATGPCPGCGGQATASVNCTGCGGRHVAAIDPTRPEDGVQWLRRPA